MAILMKATKGWPVAAVFPSAASIACLVALFWVVLCAVSWLFCFSFWRPILCMREAEVRLEKKVERRVTNLSHVCELQGCVFVLFSLSNDRRNFGCNATQRYASKSTNNIMV